MIRNGDCLDILPTLEDESVDLLVTDPPYGIGFMGKDWDRALPNINIWRECLRVLKPGAFAFVMSIPRSDCLSRMIISLEDAGFRTNFTPVYWAYASGFPKAQNIGKAVDKRGYENMKYTELSKGLCVYLKNSREALRLSTLEVAEMGKFYGKVNHGGSVSNWENGTSLPTMEQWDKLKRILRLKDLKFIQLIERAVLRREEAEREVIGKGKSGTTAIWQENGGMGDFDITKSATPQAKALDGSYGGFQPKPAVEVIIVCMKPLSEKTFVDQALLNQKGITWLDDCRIPYESEGDDRHTKSTKPGIAINNFCIGKKFYEEEWIGSNKGRFPANLLVSDDVLNDGRIQKSGKAIRHNSGGKTFGGDNIKPPMGDMGYGDSGSFSRYFDLDKCQFFIVPKASKSEKNKGLDNGDRNIHPTCKPLKLMSYLIMLGSREGDVVLDPFLGSGTTALACQNLNRACIGIELEEKYVEIATKRCSQGVLV